MRLNRKLEKKAILQRFSSLSPITSELIPYSLKQRQPVLIQGHAARHFCQGSMLDIRVFSGYISVYSWIGSMHRSTARACSSISPISAISGAPGDRLQCPMCWTVLRCPPCHRGFYCPVPENMSNLNINRNISIS